MAHLHEVRDADTHFTIDAETMVITNTNAAKNKLRVGDHNSEVLTFEIPRYIENHDVLLCDKIGIHYMNAGTNKVDVSKDVYWVTDAAVSEEDENIVLFSWLVSGNATKYVGLLSFGIMFGCLEEDNTYSYVKNTEIFSGITISDGYNFTEAVVEQYSDVLEQWKKELSQLSEEMEELTKELENGISQLSEEIKTLKENGTGGSSTGTGWNTTQINLLENIGQYLLFSDAKTGQLLFDSLITSLRNSASGGGESEEPENPDATLTSISATYTGGEVTAGTALSALTGITVIATYSDGSTVKVSGYALSGTIADGENTITVTYEGLTTTFTVTGVAESEGGGDTPTTYTITNSLTNVSTSNTAASVEAGTSYTATLTGNDGYNIDDTSVIITMGGVDVTSSVYVDGVITIAEVTGNIIIAASGVSSTLYVLAEPTTFDGASCIDTGAKLGTEEMFNSDWSIVVDITVTENVKTTVFHTGFGSRGSEHVYCSSNNNYSRWGIYFAKNNNSLGLWTNSCVIENKRFIVNHIAGSDDINVSYLNESNELNTETVKRLTNYGFEDNFHDVSVILGGAYAYNDNVNVPSASFKGTVNDFKIYQRLMSEAEIAEYMGV